MINHRKIDLRMGDGWNWFMTISNSVSGNCGSATGQRKVKCTIVQALRLCTGRMAHRGSRDIAILFLDHGTRRG